MKKLSIIIILAAALTLSACSTQQTYLKNKETGAVVYCGGGVTTDAISYAIQKSVDKDCVENLTANGYEKIEPAQ